ncbi:MAG TPA: NAD(P)-dependent oxidoreductase [Desulfonatronum sp.]|nr:NAD(P)-dependent oxidoreductase [Desulfonatronum sp.]
MNILVTGGAGYIGCHVVDILLERGHKPVVFDTFYWGTEPLKPWQDRIRIIQGDCRNSKDIIYALDGIDGIIHLAGIVGEFACKANPKAHFSSNVESTRTLVNCCTDPEMDLVRDVVYASSCSVYGNVKGLHEIVTEETPTSPLSAYAHAKLRSEEIFLQRAHEVPHFHPTNLRLTTVFGWSQRPRLDLVTNLFTYKAWKDRKIIVHGDGMQYRSLIHVRDVARALVLVLEAPRFIRSGMTFHLGEESNNKTVREIAEIVASKVPGTEIEYLSGQPTDRRDYRIQCDKIKNCIGWRAEFSVEQGVEEMLDKLNTMGWNWDNPNFRNSSFNYE